MDPADLSQAASIVTASPAVVEGFLFFFLFCSWRSFVCFEVVEVKKERLGSHKLEGKGPALSQWRRAQLDKVRSFQQIEAGAAGGAVVLCVGQKLQEKEREEIRAGLITHIVEDGRSKVTVLALKDNKPMIVDYSTVLFSTVACEVTEAELLHAQAAALGWYNKSDSTLGHKSTLQPPSGARVDAISGLDDLKRMLEDVAKGEYFFLSLFFFVC